MKDLKFTNTEKARALLQVKNGADIFSYTTAMCLIAVREESPNHVDICEAMGKYKATESHPYFGARATKEGLDWTKKIMKDKGIER